MAVRPPPAPLRRLSGPALAAVLLTLLACGGAKLALFDEDRTTSERPLLAGTDPEAPTGALADGLSAWRDGNRATAKASFEAWLREHPGSWTAHYQLGLLHRAEGRVEKARLHLERAVALQPRLIGALTHLTELYLAAGEVGAAAEAAERALTAAPDDVRVLIAAGAVRLRRGAWADAVDVLDKANALAPGHATVLYNLGLCMVARHRWPQALETAEKALAYRPGSARARALRVVALSHLGRIEEAITAGEADLDAVRPLAENHVALGRAYLLAGRKDDAIAALRRATAADAGDMALAWQNLGETLDATGDKPGAIAAYKRVLEQPGRRLEDGRRLRRRLRELQSGG